MNGTPITIGMRVMDLEANEAEGVVVAIGNNNVAYRTDSGDLYTAGWDEVAICPAKPVDGPPPRATDPAWDAVKMLFADDPLIHPLLDKIESFAGTVPPKLWFACALRWLAESTHDEQFIQLNMIQMVAEAAGQECGLMY